MMDVPQEVVEQLKCPECDMYLSRGPVYLRQDGAVACGGCFSSTRPAHRNTPYEAIARLVRFPCRNREFGCRETVGFAAEGQEVAHEATCEYRQTCAMCGAGVAMMLYCDEGGWRCERCAPARRACENQAQGCAHRDIPDKCWKHETFFCQRGTHCYICSVPVSRDTLSAHYASAHGDETCSAGSTWLATRTGGGWRWHLVNCAAGTAVCSYRLDNSQFILDVYIPVVSERLCEFRCEVRVRHPKTRLTRTYIPDITYKDSWDWAIVINQQDFAIWSDRFNVYVIIDKD